MLLVTLAFLVGPDLPHCDARTGTVTVAGAAERDPRAGGEADSLDTVAEQHALRRRQVPGLPPSQGGGVVLQPDGAAADRAPVRAGPAVEHRSRRHHTACSPEALQVFRY